QPRALPYVVVVDLGDRGAEPVLQLCLRRADEVALLLQRVRRREVQLDGEDADVARLQDFRGYAASSSAGSGLAGFGGSGTSSVVRSTSRVSKISKTSPSFTSL